MRLIDADPIYERLRDDENLARDRVIDTPNSFPNGAVNPSAIRYMAQLNERTRFKEMVFDAPTIDAAPIRRGKWIKDEFGDTRCSWCDGLATDSQEAIFDWCPYCGAKMEH